VATRTETVYHFSCDLCGNERDERELAHLWGPDPKAGKRPQIDVCPSCQDRPVAEVLAWFREQEESGGAADKPKASKPVKGSSSAPAHSV
jgi:NAD-dependent SIR2 family protein deacetylase